MSFLLLSSLSLCFQTTGVTDFTIDTVTDVTQDLRLSGQLFVEVPKVDQMVSTGNPLHDRANQCKVRITLRIRPGCT
jgi:hypothetical protein